MTGHRIPKVTENSIAVCAYKFDGVLHRSWTAELIRRDGSLLVFDAKFSEEIVHDLLGTIAVGTHSLEYYWLNRWYNIFRFAQPDGQLRNYYCNVNQPPTFDGKTLSYVDLDLDILVAPDFSYQILIPKTSRRMPNVTAILRRFRQTRAGPLTSW